jgi:hypothetical protein
VIKTDIGCQNTEYCAEGAGGHLQPSQTTRACDWWGWTGYNVSHVTGLCDWYGTDIYGLMTCAVAFLFKSFQGDIVYICEVSQIISSISLGSYYEDIYKILYFT